MTLVADPTARSLTEERHLLARDIDAELRESVPLLSELTEETRQTETVTDQSESAIASNVKNVLSDTQASSESPLDSNSSNTHLPRKSSFSNSDKEETFTSEITKPPSTDPSSPTEIPLLSEESETTPASKSSASKLDAGQTLTDESLSWSETEISSPVTKKSLLSEEPDRKSTESQSTSELDTDTVSPFVNEPVSSTFATTPLATDVGGVWYLLNILTALEWPEFEHCPNAWHQLYLLGQFLLPETSADPVWKLIAALSEARFPSTATAWLDAVLPEVETFLQFRFELETEKTAIATLTPYLHEPALIYASRTHIDVMFELEQISFDLRVAGLDQNPGWVPELAHVITFHFH